MQYQQKFLEIIKNPYQLNEQTLEVLQKLAGDYPYCQSLQILLAKNLQQYNKLEFEKQVNKAAAYSVDRRKFQRYISDRDRQLQNQLVAETPTESPLEDFTSTNIIPEEQIIPQVMSPKQEGEHGAANTAEKIQVTPEENFKEEIIIEPEENTEEIPVDADDVIIAEKLQEPDHTISETKKQTSEASINQDSKGIINTLKRKLLEFRNLNKKRNPDSPSDQTIKQEGPNLANEKPTNTDFDPTFSDKSTKAHSGSSSSATTNQGKQEEINKEVTEAAQKDQQSQQRTEIKEPLPAAPPPVEKKIVVPQHHEPAFTEHEKLAQKPDISLLIDKFLKEEPRIKISKELPERQEDLSVSSTNEDPQLVSETLAQIFHKQGNKEKALDIYEKLCLKFPEKSSYFAKKILAIKNEINI